MIISNSLLRCSVNFYGSRYLRKLVAGLWGFVLCNVLDFQRYLISVTMVVKFALQVPLILAVECNHVVFDVGIACDARPV